MTAFIDQARIRVRAGDGGNGVVAFRREKYVPQGGPSGGDGGEGGSVVLIVDEGLSTLLDFRYRQEYRASNGENGANKDMYGRGAKDLEMKVPPGTQVFDDATGNLLVDLRSHGERFVVAQGGRGGRGNKHFASSTDRAPRRAEPGSIGQERTVRLELKLLADVGLVGFPNAGKSSLIARSSAARPKIADYPFTTLVPNLGVVALPDDGVNRRTFVLADVPGLIEGAHEGAGLGHQFLRHIERTRVLVYLLDASPEPGRTPLRDFETLTRELRLYDADLATRPQFAVLNKIDVPDIRRRIATVRKAFERRGLPFFAISAATGEGVPPLLEALWRVVTDQRAQDRERERAESAAETAADSDGGMDQVQDQAMDPTANHAPQGVQDDDQETEQAGLESPPRSSTVSARKTRAGADPARPRRSAGTPSRRKAGRK